ncbi:pyrimidine 5'-nucleotidase [Legionella feeleii]|uniref:Haloacid dehalogenase n=1 Tax=Legionella feeleii TaxID=453 RepID=A0A0W0TK12_9GAMM|nr:pyrimidine 5'-nucleotidase [Legionella feeleii]KTC95964.1 haloacid dehalogenase [Legionella feeleii]SPX60276.1 haloacid dehalogenase [Legionella feeleii]
MKTYEWILFDADETLFNFDSFVGLQRLLSRFEVNFTQQDYQTYQVFNKGLWIDYQNGTITAQELQHQRFAIWADQLQVSTQFLHSTFMAIMADICTPIEGALSLLTALKGRVKLGIITNGFTELQQIRLERTGFKAYFDLLVISEQVGFAKPHRGIFEHALSLMGNPARGQVLMVGDNPDSDILGGLNAGLDTCWFNAHNNPVPPGLTPKYQVSSLAELETLLLGQKKAISADNKLAVP